MASDSDSELSHIARLAVAQTLAELGNFDRLAYTIDQAAEAVGLPRNTLRDRVASGEIPAVRRAGKWLIRKADLLKWLSD